MGETQKVDQYGRLHSCVAEWPACAEGEYNPSCCRFPKSCSCTVVHPEAGPIEVVPLDPNGETP